MLITPRLVTETMHLPKKMETTITKEKSLLRTKSIEASSDKQKKKSSTSSNELALKTSSIEEQREKLASSKQEKKRKKKSTLDSIPEHVEDELDGLNTFRPDQQAPLQIREP